jgi:hypothetical protein
MTSPMPPIPASTRNAYLTALSPESATAAAPAMTMRATRKSRPFLVEMSVAAVTNHWLPDTCPNAAMPGASACVTVATEKRPSATNSDHVIIQLPVKPSHGESVRPTKT